MKLKELAKKYQSTDIWTGFGFLTIGLTFWLLYLLGINLIEYYL